MQPVLIGKSFTVYTPGLLRTSTSSPSWNVEPLVFALLVMADIPVFVIAVLGKPPTVGDDNQESMDGHKEF